jgi:hypothetical protein
VEGRGRGLDEGDQLVGVRALRGRQWRHGALGDNVAEQCLSCAITMALYGDPGPYRSEI